MCVLYHTQICREQEGKKNGHDFILPELGFRQCRSECQSLARGSPCMRAAACTVLQAIHGLLPPQASDLSLPLTWHQHLHRDSTGEPGDPAWGWSGGAGWATGQETLNQPSAPKSLQLTLPHFITDTHTHSLPFTWVLLMDLGLGSADNINGSRLTEVPLQWTVCLCVYMHTHFFKSNSRQSHKICRTGRCNPSSLHILLSVSLSDLQVGWSKVKMRCC